MLLGARILRITIPVFGCDSSVLPGREGHGSRGCLPHRAGWSTRADRVQPCPDPTDAAAAVWSWVAVSSRVGGCTLCALIVCVLQQLQRRLRGHAEVFEHGAHQGAGDQPASDKGRETHRLGRAKAQPADQNASGGLLPAVIGSSPIRDALTAERRRGVDIQVQHQDRVPHARRAQSRT